MKKEQRQFRSLAMLNDKSVYFMPSTSCHLLYLSTLNEPRWESPHSFDAFQQASTSGWMSDVSTDLVDFIQGG